MFSDQSPSMVHLRLLSVIVDQYTTYLEGEPNCLDEAISLARDIAENSANISTGDWPIIKKLIKRLENLERE